MEGSIDTLAALIANAGGLLSRVVRRFDLALLAGGLMLHLAADVVRNGGWYGVLRAVGPEHRMLRLRDVQAAAFAGGGVNALVPARAGDLVKLAVLRRRLPDARFPTLAATLVPETLFEWVVGAALLTWALAAGYLPVSIFAGTLAGGAKHPVTAAVAVAVAAAAIAAGITLTRRRARTSTRRLSHDLAAGLAILRHPGAFLTGVVSWQLAARVIRLGAIACCLSACRLPGGLAAAAVAMAVDGGTRLRFAPASAGLRVGLLAYALPAATGTAVSLGAVIAYLAVVKTVRTACSLVIAAAVLVATFGSHSPRRALAALRRLRAAAPVEPPAAEAPAPSH
jgi:hypothetical protein